MSFLKLEMLFFAFLIGPIIGFHINLENEVRKAQGDIEFRDFDRMTKGAQSQRFGLKKFNDV